MRDLQCVSLINLRRFFLSLVFSQLYGLIFVDEGQVEFERGVGIFFKRSLGLQDSFPHVVAMAMLDIKHVSVFQFEQRSKFLLRWEKQERYPVFEALAADRIDLFPRGVGLNAKYGEMLHSLDLLRTFDFSEHYREIKTKLEARVGTRHMEGLLAAEGRAFWTILAPGGHLSNPLKQVLSRLAFECLRIVCQFLADTLCWTALRRPNRSCPFCKQKFTMAHFFSCPHFPTQNCAWTVFVEFCRVEAWEDVIDLIFYVLQTWVTSTDLFRDDFRLHVLEFENLCEDVNRAAFRWNF
jgi:hypothetical protein